MFALLLDCQRETAVSDAVRPATTAPLETHDETRDETRASCTWSEPAREIAKVQDERLDEVSGLAASLAHAGVLYVHNDSGDSPRFFAIDATGRTVGVFTLPLDSWQDCEDIAVAPAADNRSYVYLGDTGDNAARTGIGIPRDSIAVHRLPEPALPAEVGGTVRVERLETLRLRYPDRPHDAETLLVDPRSGDVFVLTKENDGQSQLFRAKAPRPGNVSTLEPAAKLQFGRGVLPGNPQTTAGDIARDGASIVIRTYSNAFVWQRGATESVSQALGAIPKRLPLPHEIQGEAIGFAADGSGFYTTSERTHQPLFFLPCR